MNSSHAIQDVPSPPEGWRFFLESLSDWPGLSLSRCVGGSIASGEGRLVALLPTETPLSCAARVAEALPSDGGVQDRSRRALCELIHAVLLADRAVLVLEDAMLKARDARGTGMLDHEVALTHGEELYALIAPDRGTPDDIARSLVAHSAAGSCLNGFAIVWASAPRELTDLSSREWQGLASSVVLAFCEAYDGDSFLVWRKS